MSLAQAAVSFETLLPQAEQSQLALLQIMLDSPETIPYILKEVKRGDFTISMYIDAFDAIKKTFDLYGSTDIVTLTQYWESKGVKQDQIDRYHTDLMTMTYVYGWEAHVRIVKESAYRRRLAWAAQSDLQDAVNPDLKVCELSERIAARHKALSYRGENGREFTSAGDLFNDYLKMMETIRNGGDTGVIPTGFHAYDGVTAGGMWPGDMIVLAGRPGHGKTALALSIMKLAAERGVLSGMVSLEMSRFQLSHRLVAMDTGIDLEKIRRVTTLTEAEVERVLSSKERFDALPMLFEDKSFSISDVAYAIQDLVLKGCKFIIVDYLQLISEVVSRPEKNRTEAVSEASRMIKRAGMKFDIPVIAISQLSRSAETRHNKRPVLTDLRESGQIEQDGDVIAFVYRDVLSNPDTEFPSMAELIFGKNRQGPAPLVRPLYYNGPTTQFKDIAYRTNNSPEETEVKGDDIWV